MLTLIIGAAAVFFFYYRNRQTELREAWTQTKNAGDNAWEKTKSTGDSVLMPDAQKSSGSDDKKTPAPATAPKK
ncbi:MAG: hypothetical protein IJW35_04395 [Lentisphaeria bacterium]|nr:hypothetical protein [Lentisphaeria bacterium]